MQLSLETVFLSVKTDTQLPWLLKRFKKYFSLSELHSFCKWNKDLDLVVYLLAFQLHTKEIEVVISDSVATNSNVAYATLF